MYLRICIAIIIPASILLAPIYAVAFTSSSKLTAPLTVTSSRSTPVFGGLLLPLIASLAVGTLAVAFHRKLSSTKRL